ncbi:hypothetical protein Tco_1331360 [Tanacetum coccineum]
MDRVIEPVVADDIVEAAIEDYPDLDYGYRGREERQLEADSMIASGERAGLLDRVASLERSNVRLQGTLMMESARADRHR